MNGLFILLVWIDGYYGRVSEGIDFFMNDPYYKTLVQRLLM